jgi:hypothetical protein
MRRARKKRNKAKPKSALSSFMLFVVKNRPEIVASTDPPMTFRETGRVLGQKWRALSDLDRQPYIDLASADRQRFINETTAYKAGTAQRALDAREKRAKLKHNRVLENSIVNGIRDAITTHRPVPAKKQKKPLPKRQAVAIYVSDYITDLLTTATPPEDEDMVIDGDGMPVSQSAFIEKILVKWSASPDLQTKYAAKALTDVVRFDAELAAYNTK